MRANITNLPHIHFFQQSNSTTHTVYLRQLRQYEYISLQYVSCVSCIFSIDTGTSFTYTHRNLLYMLCLLKKEMMRAHTEIIWYIKFICKTKNMNAITKTIPHFYDEKRKPKKIIHYHYFFFL